MITRIDVTKPGWEMPEVEIRCDRYGRDEEGVITTTGAVITAELTRAEAKQLRALLDTIEQRVMAIYGGPHTPAYPQDE